MKHFLFILSLLFVALPAAAFTPLEQQSVVKIEVFRNVGDRDAVQQGSGFFVNYEGCAVTTAHVLYNQLNRSEVFPVIKIYVPENIRKNPVSHGLADIRYLDPKLDVAVVCLRDPHGFFYHPLSLLPAGEYNNLEIGELMYLGGYPIIGGSTPVYSQSHIVGFWDNPNLSELLKLDYFDAQNITLFKVDGIMGPGGSGGPVLSAKRGNAVVGMVFASSLSPSGINFLLSSDTIQKGLDTYRAVENQKASTDSPCVFDPAKGLYGKNGKDFYDMLCSRFRDPKTEQVVSLNYEDRCKRPMPRQRLYDASSYIISGRGNVDSLWQYLIKLCSPEPAGAKDPSPLPSPRNGEVSIPKIGEGSLLVEKIFAYGKPRVEDLKTEQSAALKLKSELVKILGAKNLKISDKNWSSLVNAYVYGQYPIPAIARSIQLGGYTVHPQIAFGEWKKSGDYARGMK
ncbi:MAG: hypothetical protein G01um101418_173 [Parcubacteria group bacterium Gr01-1014_18]|nr:MAG: hypothetical protein Greene041636_141 [Parcubacteria group bacterium Greene0416_36]TSC81333.1 MAG: hypothetical protein G01um101418_173 [Parcubacteria group bacterium Gr01-1014_18]TSC99481.1 MAG: hypothetical protein Greene101420_148 [Parcubacteria group bacterium Greene1014_20]TSD07600.1 MAG: hypothetical protein Greene07142_57 [Parcubacteria group bacterium Greene0714_2]